MRQGRRLLAVLLLGPVAAFVLLEVACASVDRGRWVCSVCGLHERRTQLGGLCLQRQVLSSAYHDWFVSNVGLPHEHDWLHAGCHGRGFVVTGILACGPDYERNGFFQFLPSWSDQEKAVQAAKRLAALDRETRRDELQDSDVLAVLSWATEAGAPHAQVVPEYSAWRQRHARWQDLLPE